MQQNFENNDFTGRDQGYIGGYYDNNGGNLKIKITPDESFRIDLFNSYNFLSDFIDEAEFNILTENIHNINHKIYKNPTLILVALIIVKRSKKQPIEPTILRNVYSDEVISILLKENNISQYDLLRYSRYLILHMKNFVSKIKENN